MSCNNSNGFFAFLGGALIGGVAALLLAPQKGEKTRRCIKSRLRGLSGVVYLDEEEVSEMIERVSSEADDESPEPEN